HRPSSGAVTTTAPTSLAVSAVCCRPHVYEAVTARVYRPARTSSGTVTAQEVCSDASVRSDGERLAVEAVTAQPVGAVTDTRRSRTVPTPRLVTVVASEPVPGTSVSSAPATVTA